MKDHEVEYAKLAIEVRPAHGPGGENAEISVHIEGTKNDLLNAFSQISQHLFKHLIEKDGKDEAMALYAATQMNALKAIGIDPEEEVVKGMEQHMKRLDALLSILGKTFTVDGEEVKDGDDE